MRMKKQEKSKKSKKMGWEEGKSEEFTQLLIAASRLRVAFSGDWIGGHQYRLPP